MKIFHFRAAHYGELASECVKLYYKYGCALLYKAQEEADPLGAVPKKEGESDKAESVKIANGESSKASVSSNADMVDGVTDDGWYLPHDVWVIEFLTYIFLFFYLDIFYFTLFKI